MDRTLGFSLLRVAAVFICFLSFTLGCGDGTPAPNCPEGSGCWYLATEWQDASTGFGGPEPGVWIDGVWVPPDWVGAVGDESPFRQQTNFAGDATIVRRAPATWSLKWESSNDQTSACDGQAVQANVSPGLTRYLVCKVSGGGIETAVAAGFSPNPVYTYAPPATGTVTGSGFSQAYGMPLVQYYSPNGTLVAQETATSVSSDGTSMVIPGFGTSTLPAGSYLGYVSNAGPNGTLSIIGSGAVRVLTPNVTVVGRERTGQSGGNSFYDTGAVSVTANGLTKTVPYSQYGSTATIAAALSAAFNSDSASPVTTSAGADVLWLAGKSNTSTTSLPIAASSQGTSGAFSGLASFLSVPSESVIGTGSFTIVGTDGYDYNGGFPIYDTGTVSVTVNGFTKSVGYSRYHSYVTIATNLSNAFSSDSASPVTASAAGAVLTLTSKSGSTSSLTMAASSQSTGANAFSGVPSFLALPSQSMKGTASLTVVGADRTIKSGGTTIYDTGTVSVTVNGFTKSVAYSRYSYGTIATNLSNAFNSDSASPVTASATGFVLTLTSKSGSTSSLTVSASSRSTSGAFSGVASFLPIPSGF
jgi:hypothetical protein